MVAKNPFSFDQRNQGQGHDKQGHQDVANSQGNDRKVESRPKTLVVIHCQASEGVPDECNEDDQSEGKRAQNDFILTVTKPW